MSIEIYGVNFEKYCTDANLESIPNGPGIYQVCVGEPDDTPGNLPTIGETIYIGESENVRERIQNHTSKGEWERSLSPWECLHYTYGCVSDCSKRKEIEAKMISDMKPKYNKQHNS